VERDIERTEEWNNNGPHPPTIDDVRKAIGRLKNNRSPGSSNIIAELLKTKQRIIQITLHKTSLSSLGGKKIPKQWEDGFISPIHKKGTN